MQQMKMEAVLPRAVSRRSPAPVQAVGVSSPGGADVWKPKAELLLGVRDPPPQSESRAGGPWGTRQRGPRSATGGSQRARSPPGLGARLQTAKVISAGEG